MEGLFLSSVGRDEDLIYERAWRAMARGARMGHAVDERAKDDQLAEIQEDLGVDCDHVAWR